MKKIGFTIGFLFFYVPSVYPQQEPVKIEGNTQGTTYHITYFDEQNSC